MKNKILFSSICLLLCIVSCKKEEESDNKDFFSIFSNGNLDGVTPSGAISFFANGLYENSTRIPTTLHAHFKGDDEYRVAPEVFRINGVNVPITDHNLYQIPDPYRRLSWENDRRFQDTILSFFGRNTIVEVQSEIFGNFTKTFYVPKELKVSLYLDIREGRIFRNRDLVVNWNADPQNPLPVAIIVHYNGVRSRRINPNLPDGDINVFRLVPDNGTYTIPASDLQILPLGGLVKVMVIRGIQEHAESSRGKHVVINAIANVSTDDYEVVAE